MEEAAPSALCPGWGIAAQAPGPPPSIEDAPRTAFPPRQQQSPEGRRSLSDEDEAWAPGARYPGMQETGMGASSQPPGPSAGVPPPQMTPLRPQQGLSPARVQNGLECGTAPPSQGSSAGPRGGGPGLSGGRQGQLEARAAGPPTQHGQHAEPTRTLHTPWGHSQDDPRVQTPSKDRHWAPVSSTGTVHPAGRSHCHCPGEAGPRLHRRWAERPEEGRREGGRPCPHGSRTGSALHVPGAGSMCTQSCLQKQTERHTAGSRTSQLIGRGMEPGGLPGHAEHHTCTHKDTLHRELCVPSTHSEKLNNIF